MKKIFVVLVLVVFGVGVSGCDVFSALTSGEWADVALPTSTQAQEQIVLQDQDVEEQVATAVAATQAAMIAISTQPAPANPATPTYTPFVPADVPSGDIALGGYSWVLRRTSEQVPQNCSQTGMCPINFDVPYGGATMIWGSPMEGLGESIMLDAGKREAQVWVFLNREPNQRTVSLTMKAWSGANGLHGYHSADSSLIPSDGATQALAEEMIARAFGFLRQPGNCGADSQNPADQSCAADKIGYLTFACTANDTCSRIGYFNPSQDSGGWENLITRHQEIFGSSPAR